MPTLAAGVPRLTRWKGQALFVAGSALLCYFFYAAFTTYLSVRWAYFGFAYANKGPTAALAAFVLGVAPSFWIPYASNRPSIPITWALYLLVFIPSMFCLALMSPSLTDAAPLLLSLFFGMLTLAASYRLGLWSSRGSRLRHAAYRPFMTGTWIAVVIMVGATLYSFRDSLQMPSLETMYETRLAARSIQQELSIGRYFAHWLSRCLLPFLLAVSLWKRRPHTVGLILALYVLLFMTTAHRVFFLVPAVVIGLHLLIKWFPRYAGTALVYSLVALSAIALLVDFTPLSDFLFMRTMGWSGLASYIYDDFIRSHPLTWWSHIKGFSLFTDNPYSEGIPFVIGYEYWNNPDLTSNAHFWAMDGIMAAGNAGVLVISVACAALLYTIDRLGRTVEPAVAMPWLAAYATSLGDAGLFSALLTGGLGFVLLMLLVLPDELRATPGTLGPRAPSARGRLRLDPADGRASGTAAR